MTTTMTIDDLIYEHSTGDPDLTAAAVMDALRVPKRWRVLFWPLLRDECRRLHRSTVRAIEQSSGATDHHGSDTHDPHVGGTGITRTEYLAQRFYTGTEYVTWGSATVQDHQDRIDYLSKLRGGITDTIGRHAEAIELLESADVSCLDKLDKAVPV